MHALSDDILRQNEIRRERGRLARGAVLGTVVQAQLLFWSWVVGWLMGPAPMQPPELIAGALFTFAVGAALAFPFVRRRVEAGVALVLKLDENGRRCRVAVFDEYLTIGEEIVLRSAVQQVDLSGRVLHLTYAGASDRVSVSRSFTGGARDLSRLRSELDPGAET